MLPSYLSLQECRHGLMLYPKTDAYVGRSLEVYGEYSPDEYLMFRQLVRPGMVALEIGGNIGAHTVPLARLIGNGGALLAFEPQAVLMHILAANLALNDLQNVRIYQVGIGHEPGVLHLPLIDYAYPNNFGAFQLGGTGAQTVEIRTIDSYNLTRCDFIKIDVEGMEVEAISGAIETIRKFRPIMYVENDRQDKSPTLLSLINSLGYRLWWHFPPLFSQDNWKGQAENIFPGNVSVNLVCIPNEVAFQTDLREIKSTDEDWFSIVNGRA